jgi:hypothetical protein
LQEPICARRLDRRGEQVRLRERELQSPRALRVIKICLMSRKGRSSMMPRSFCFALGLVAVASVINQAADAQATESLPTPVIAPAAPLAPQPITRALLPGHWQLQGAGYVWVPPETRLRVVEARPLIPGQNVWTHGRWIFVPTHYGSPY